MVKKNNSQKEKTRKNGKHGKNGKHVSAENQQEARSCAQSTKGARAAKKSSPEGAPRASGKKRKSVVLDHERISERAKDIWRQRGCVPGEDERNWFEAENELLKQEIGMS